MGNRSEKEVAAVRKALAVILVLSSFLTVVSPAAADPSTPATPASNYSSALADAEVKIANLTQLTRVQGEAYKTATTEISMLRDQLASVNVQLAKVTAELAITEGELNRARADLWVAQAAARAAAAPASTTTTLITEEKTKALLAAQPPGRDYVLFAESGVWLARGSISKLRGYQTGLISQVAPGPRENGADDQYLEWIPVRAVAEALGYRVRWEPKLQVVDMESRSRVIFFHTREPFGFVQGQRTAFTVPDISVKTFISQDNRSMVPLPFVLNHLGWERGQVSLREQGPGYIILELSTLG